jgi:hypothetical protein
MIRNQKRHGELAGTAKWSCRIDGPDRRHPGAEKCFDRDALKTRFPRPPLASSSASGNRRTWISARRHAVLIFKTAIPGWTVGKQDFRVSFRARFGT